MVGVSPIGERSGDKTMLRKAMISVVVAILCIGILGGCSKEKEPATVPEEPVKTAAEYKVEADKEITEQNMDQELDKLEKEVGAEADANQT